MKNKGHNNSRRLLRYGLSLFLICTFQFSIGQIRIHNLVDTFFYCSKYDYYLKRNSTDTSFHFLKVDSKSTDIEKISGEFYKGEYEYAKFKINEKQKTVFVQLFDKNKILLKSENYYFDNAITTRSDKYFFNLSSIEKTLTWKIISLQ